MANSQTVTTQVEGVIPSPPHMSLRMCRGPLFMSSSVCGRGTTVFYVFDRASDEETQLTLNMSRQDLNCAIDRVAVKKTNSSPNVTMSLESIKDQTCTNHDTVRDFFDGDRVDVEKRVLSISTSELKRPVEYFWGVHDFVRGIRGALIGHQHLTSIGILHRDISETNIALGLYPWDERGYLIDFDMAILQATEEPTEFPSIQCADQPDTIEPVQLDETAHFKGTCAQTGILPYVSSSVLRGERHTRFDNVESFLYVLLLFFFSYAGPLSKEELLDAQKKGFARPTGSGRLPHMRRWPYRFTIWADAHYPRPKNIGMDKGSRILDPEGLGCLNSSGDVCLRLNENWPEDLQYPICSLLKDTLQVFRGSVKGGTDIVHTQVTHAQFIDVLDKWLVEHAELESRYSNCPDFKDPRHPFTFRRNNE